MDSPWPILCDPHERISTRLERSLSFPVKTIKSKVLIGKQSQSECFNHHSSGQTSQRAPKSEMYHRDELLIGSKCLNKKASRARKLSHSIGLIDDDCTEMSPENYSAANRLGLVCDFEARRRENSSKTLSGSLLTGELKQNLVSLSARPRRRLGRRRRRGEEIWSLAKSAPVFQQLIVSMLLTVIFLSSLSAPIHCQTPTRSSESQASFGCPYPGVGSNCQVNIVAQAPAVPLLSTEYVADEYATLKPDTQASYKCDLGYELLGQETLTCLPSGRWSGQPPSCVTNIAIGKPTNQSSTVKGGDSRNANDGKLITQHDSKHCTETRVDQSPWWQIDLLQLYEIRSVRLLGRANGNQQMSLHDIEIRVGNSSSLQGNRLCAWYPNNLDEGVARDFQCAHPIIGRFVSIQMVGIEAALSLCEVMVLSNREFPADRCSVQATLAPSNSNRQSGSGAPTTTSTTTTTTTATTTQLSQSPGGAADNQLVVFNRTCYEMQASNGGSFLVADTYCKARGGALLHSVNNLTQAFISHELERMKSKLKSKLVWLGAKREVSSPNALGAITSGSTSALIGIEQPATSLISPSGRSLSASLNESPFENLFSSDDGLTAAREPSPIFSPLRIPRATIMYQASSGAGGSTSRGSQTFGLPTTGNNNSGSSNRTVEHTQRSLIVSQPNQVASFFTPPVPISPLNSAPISNPLPGAPTLPTNSPAPSNPVLNLAGLHREAHRSLRPPSLTPISSPPVAPSASISTSSASVNQPSWTGPASTSQQGTSTSLVQSSNSNWRWVGDAPSETIQSQVTSFLWAEDQPNNYNNQQDCIVLDGGKKWLWNDVTCELDYLPWVCQYRPSTCGSPDRQENSTILEMSSSTNDVANTQEVTAFQMGKSITYACPVGHKLEGSKQRRCQYDGSWSGRAPKCQYVNCGQVSSQIENGRVVYLNQSQTTYGSQVKYVCYEDYVLVGNDLRQCQSDGKWAGKQPFCAYKWCPNLQQIPNGYLNVSSYSENSIASYQCNSGYKLIGNDTRQCLLGGKWTNQEPFCQYVDCGQPKQILNGNYQLVNSTTNYLSVALYTCNDNYTLASPNTNKMICSHNNRWTGKEPQCSLIDCGQPQANAGSSFIGTSFSVHSTIYYKCDPGFKEVSGSSQRTCNLDGQWSGQPISCKYVDCGRVPAILKGEISYINGTTYLASQVAYECTPGNRLSGHRIRFCGPDGRWTGSSPKCEEVRCDAPALPANGSAIYIGNDRSFKEQSFSVGVTVQYECDYGHVVKGSWSSRLCQASGEWSGEPPVCKFVDCGTPPSIENGNYLLKHPPAGSVGSASQVESASGGSGGPSNRRSDSSGAGQTGAFTYYGTIAHYGCEPNFKMQGPSQRECLDSGQWRTPLPTCEAVQCPKPEHFDEFTQVSLVARSGSQQVEGSAGHQASGSSGDQQTSGQPTKSVRLIANNQWINHDSSSQSFGVGDKLYYSCVPGYELYGGPEIRTCTQYGQWSGSSTPRCRLIDCGRPTPIGQEGRFYLLNETTTFNSLVEYSCVRPFKLIETKIRQAGNLIETLNTAQAGVTPILTSLPIGVKVCANNGQWMPNDQQPKCVGATSDPSNGQFDGGDNALDSSQRIQSNSATTNLNGANNNLADGNVADKNHLLDGAGGHQSSSSAHQFVYNSIWAKVMIAICLLVMLSLIILTLICIRSGKRKPKQVNRAHRASILAAATNGGHSSAAAAAAAAAAMQIQLASGGVVSGKSLQKHQQQQQAAAAAAQSILSGNHQNIYINGAQKMFQSSMIGGSNQMSGSHHAQHLMSHQAHLAYGDAGSVTLAHQPSGLMLAAGNGQNRSMMSVGGAGGDVGVNKLMMGANRSSSLGVVGDRLLQSQLAGADHPMMDSYSRLSIDSESNMHQMNAQQAIKAQIRHNPNGLVTFVSPAQQQHNRDSNGPNHQQQTSGGSSSQHQVSPQSISTSLSISSSSSPSSSSSAHHTTATRLSGSTDSASSSSSTSAPNAHHNSGVNLNQNNASEYQSTQLFQQHPPINQSAPSPPCLPSQPPPPHRLQQHHKQLLKQQQQQQQSMARQQVNRLSTDSAATGNHHYMEPTI